MYRPLLWGQIDRQLYNLTSPLFLRLFPSMTWSPNGLCPVLVVVFSFFQLYFLTRSFFLWGWFFVAEVEFPWLSLLVLIVAITTCCYIYGCFCHTYLYSRVWGIPCHILLQKMSHVGLFFPDCSVWLWWWNSVRVEEYLCCCVLLEVPGSL